MKAFGFILRAASGENARLHEDAMMLEAARLGFNWSATFFEDDRKESNYVRMVNRIMRENVDAVFLPGADHLSGQDVEVMATHCDVYCLADGQWHTVHTEDDPGPRGSPRAVDFRNDPGED